MVASLLQLPDVREVVGLENTSNLTDSNGVPGHSLNLIVEGGEEQAIAVTVFRQKTAGTGLFGAVVVEVEDGQGLRRSIRFDRPVVVDCAAFIEVRRDADFTAVDTDALKAALSSTLFGIGQDVQLSRLYSPLNTVQGFWISQLKIGRLGHALGSANLTIGVRERARFALADIEVVVL